MIIAYTLGESRMLHHQLLVAKHTAPFCQGSSYLLVCYLSQIEIIGQPRNTRYSFIVLANTKLISLYTNSGLLLPGQVHHLTKYSVILLKGSFSLLSTLYFVGISA